MAINYFEDRRPRSTGYHGKTFTAVNMAPKVYDDGVGSYLPSANMTVNVVPTQYVPTFSTGEDDTSGHWLHDIAKGLGVHPSYAHRVFEQGLARDNGYDSEATELLREAASASPSQLGGFVQKLKKFPEFKQPETLFVEKPGHVQVTGMYADPSMKASAMTLGALAMRRYPHLKMMADESLSEQSSALARHAHSLGLVEPDPENPTMTQTNDMIGIEQGFSPDLTHQVNAEEWYLPGAGRARPISDTEVTQARQHMRGILRNNRGSAANPRLSDQFEHPRLPGF